MTVNDAVDALAMGAWAPAMAAFLGHLAHDRTDGRVWMYLGIAYAETGFQDEALQALRVAELLEEDNVELIEALGCTYLRRGEPGPALRYLETAVTYPDCPASVYRNLSVALFKIGNLMRALKAASAAIAMEPDDVLALYSKAIILTELGVRHNAASHVVHAPERIAPVTHDELRAVVADILSRTNVPPAITRSALGLSQFLARMAP